MKVGCYWVTARNIFTKESWSRTSYRAWHQLWWYFSIFTFRCSISYVIRIPSSCMKENWISTIKIFIFHIFMYKWCKLILKRSSRWAWTRRSPFAYIWFYSCCINSAISKDEVIMPGHILSHIFILLNLDHSKLCNFCKICRVIKRHVCSFIMI